MFKGSIWGDSFKNSSSILSQIKFPLAELKQSQNPRFHDHITRILQFFFGKYSIPGILAKFTADYINSYPAEWVRQMEKILEQIDPSSRIFKKIQEKKQSRIIIDSSYLPPHTDGLNKDQYFKVREIKVVPSGLSMPLLDAFFIMLVRAIYDSPYYCPDLTQYDYLTIDDVYNSLSRNCLLVLLRRFIDYFSSNSQIENLRKLMQIMKMFFCQEIINKYEKYSMNYKDNSKDQSLDRSSLSIEDEVTKSLKCKLKSHHLHAMMLMLKKRDLLRVQFQDFHKYIEGILHFYNKLNSDKFFLSSLIRLWIYYAIYQDRNNLENQMLNVLEKAVSDQGCFYLQRYNPTQIRIQQLYEIRIPKKILQALGRGKYWQPNTLYLFTIACFCNLLDSAGMFFNNGGMDRISGTTEKNSCSNIRSILTIIDQNTTEMMAYIKKTNSSQVEIKKAYDSMKNCLQIIQNYYNNILNSIQKHNNYGYLSSREYQPNVQKQFKFKPIDMNFQKNESSDMVTNDGFIGHNYEEVNQMDSQRKILSFYRREHRSCWNIPIQYNQSILLYYLFYGIAKAVDYVIPGHSRRDSPVLNLRVLANPITFGGFMALFIILYLYLWK